MEAAPSGCCYHCPWTRGTSWGLMQAGLKCWVKSIASAPGWPAPLGRVGVPASPHMDLPTATSAPKVPLLKGRRWPSGGTGGSPTEAATCLHPHKLLILPQPNPKKGGLVSCCGLEAVLTQPATGPKNYPGQGRGPRLFGPVGHIGRDSSIPSGNVGPGFWVLLHLKEVKSSYSLPSRLTFALGFVRDWGRGTCHLFCKS